MVKGLHPRHIKKVGSKHYWLHRLHLFATFLVWLLTLCASVRLFSIVVEQMVLQNSISTNDFSHSVQGWSFSPVCISKCLPKVLELLNDFLHSVVQLCGFHHCQWICALSVFQFVWMSCCTVHKCGDSPSMKKHMSAQVSSLAEWLFAFCALVQFLSTVGEHMSDYVIAE